MTENNDILKSEQLIYGRHPVLEALQSKMVMERVFLQQNIRGVYEKEVRRLCKQETIPLKVVPKEKLNQLTKGNHQGIVGVLPLIRYYRLEDFVPLLFEQQKNPLLVLLDGVTDVRNFGAIARSAECLGAHALVLAKKGAAPVNSEAIKASAGALTKIPVCRESSITKAIETLQLSGVAVFASSLTAVRPLSEVDFEKPSAFILGSEGKGLHPSVLAKTDGQFVIPQVGTTDSLNVSVAAGIILYEIGRQRNKR